RCGARHAPRAVMSERSREEPSAATRPERSEVWREARTPSAARRCCRSDAADDRNSEGVPPERRRGGSEQRQVAAQLEGADLGTVLDPLLALVAQEEVEDVFAQRLGE